MGKNKRADLKNILITGGAGFIGSSLALKLIGLGYAVTVLDSLSEQIHGKDPEKNSHLYLRIAGKVHFIKGDITNRSDVEKALEGQNAIIHLAAETGTGQSMYQIEKYSHVNVYGTSLLLDAIVNTKNSVKKMILASSRAVYGEGKYINSNSEIRYPNQRNSATMQRGIFDMTEENGEILQSLPTDENSKLHPTSFYGITKLQQEQMVEHVCKSIGIDFTILRYQNVYGKGQSLLNPYTGILSIFSTQILNGKSLNIFEDGLPTRDFINIEDVVFATVKSLETDRANNEIINVGNGIATSVLEIALLLAEKYNKETALDISGDFRLGDIRHNFADLKKMSETLDFEPSISLKEGMQEFTDWVLSQPIPEDNFGNSLIEMKKKGFLKS